MSSELRDRVALVCGGSRGLGFAIAESLARRGAKIVLCARSPGALEEAASALAALGAEVLAVPSDLTVEEDIGRVVRGAEERFGRIDILVANTAHPKMGAFSTLNEADWREGFEGTFVPVLRLLHATLPGMKERGWGRVICISSTAVRAPGLTYLLSGVFRTALASLFKSLSLEHGRDGICFNSLCPGLIRTPLGESILRASAEKKGISVEQAEAEYARQTAVGKIGEPEQVGELAAFLCSDAASHITGQLINIDGGKTPSLF